MVFITIQGVFSSRVHNLGIPEYLPEYDQRSRGRYPSVDQQVWYPAVDSQV